MIPGFATVLAAILAWLRIAFKHARMFFNRPDFDLATAAPGSYALVPHHAMLTNIEQDYDAMSGIIFGDVPAFGAIIESIMNLEKRLNG
jgi:hypothetical protein